MLTLDRLPQSLFPIHIHVSDKGFIFINFSAEEPVAFGDHFGSLTNEWSKLPVDEYSYAYSWQVTGKFNWKSDLVFSYSPSFS